MHMDDENNPSTDTSAKQPGATTKLPSDITFVCAHEESVSLISMEQALYLHRAEAHDELWSIWGELDLKEGNRDEIPSPQALEQKASSVGIVRSAPRNGDELTACLNLIEGMIRSMIGFGWPGRFLVPGIVDAAAFKAILDPIDRELTENEQKAWDHETAIIKLARELSLNPRPSGTGPSSWWANCPETNHSLCIHAAGNEFGCPWCKRKGGPEELKALVKERKTWRETLRTRPSESQ